MSISPEALNTWGKAQSKLRDALTLSAEVFPGNVVMSSYYAMRNAAVAVLLHVDGSAPTVESQIIARFGTVVGTNGEAHGKAFNSAFDLRTVEDYDPVDSATPEDAEAVREDAVALLKYCSDVYGFPDGNRASDAPAS